MVVLCWVHYVLQHQTGSAFFSVLFCAPSVTCAHPAVCTDIMQMSAKAYVGEDLVCEAELTLVMGK